MKRSMALLLAFVFSLAAASTPALAQATPPYKRTILVGGGTNPRVNGTRLLNALAQTGATGPNNRWLVRLEPGVYNLDSSSMVMKNFVDVEGSGRGVTTITSRANLTIRFPPDVSAELRDLTVQNFASVPGLAEGILLESSKARVSRVNVLARGATSAHSIRVHFAAEAITPVLTDLQLTASNTSPNHFATGLLIATANPVVRNVAVTLSDSPNIEAISVSLGSDALLEEVEISVSGNCQVCTGVGVQNSSLKLTRSRIEVTGFFAAAVQHAQVGTVEISHSSLKAVGSSITGHGIQEVGTGTLLVEHSTVEGRASNQEGGSIYSVGGATVRVGASRLVGPVRKGLPSDPPSTFTCQGVYNESFQPLGTSCQ